MVGEGGKKKEIVRNEENLHSMVEIIFPCSALPVATFKYYLQKFSSVLLDRETNQRYFLDRNLLKKKIENRNFKG